MKVINNVDDAVERLEEMFPYEGTEMGEMWEYLTCLWRRRDYFSKEFLIPLEKEIIHQAVEIYMNYEMVEDEVTYTQTTKNLRYILDSLN